MPSTATATCAATLTRLFDGLERVQREQPILFPVHPRTRRCIERHGLADRLQSMPGLVQIQPLGYLDFLKLLTDARLVLTDSGGIQEETAILHTPCLTLRENTERPSTLEHGTNRLVGTDPGRIIAGYEQAMTETRQPPATPPLWDGRAAQRITAILRRQLT